jgi:hypothetical protein
MKSSSFCFYFWKTGWLCGIHFLLPWPQGAERWGHKSQKPCWSNWDEGAVTWVRDRNNWQQCQQEADGKRWFSNRLECKLGDSLCISIGPGSQPHSELSPSNPPTPSHLITNGAFSGSVRSNVDNWLESKSFCFGSQISITQGLLGLFG